MIVSMGEVLIDFVPQPGADVVYAPCPGGSPFNVAVAAARLGVPAGFLGAVSRDFLGDMIYGRLEAEGLVTRFTARSERPTTLSFVQLEKGSEPRYAFFSENAADRYFSMADVARDVMEGVSCLEFGSISLLLEPLATTVRDLVGRLRGRVVLSFDPNVRPVLVRDRAAYVGMVQDCVALSTVVKVSGADLEWLYPGVPVGESAGHWQSLGGGLVVVTLGGDGAVLHGPKFVLEEPEYDVVVRDTIGAGDTFHAALLARMFQLGVLDVNVAEVLTREQAGDVLGYAVKASAINCSRQGADPPRVGEMG